MGSLQLVWLLKFMDYKNTRKKHIKMTSLAEVHKLLLELQKEQQASNAKIDSLLDEIKVKNGKIESRDIRGRDSYAEKYN